MSTSQALVLHSEEREAALTAARLRVPREDPVLRPPSPEVQGLLDERLARQHQCLPLRLDGRRLVLAMADPSAVDAIRDVEFATGLIVRPVVAARSKIAAATDALYAGKSRLQSLLDDIKTDTDVDFEIDRSEVETEQTAALDDAPAVKLCNVLIAEAIREGASDIHVEPGSLDVSVRFRVDGLLRERMHVPRWLLPSIVVRFKVLGKLDIAERRVPQDGRMRATLGQTHRDIRISVLPTHLGEKVVLRLLGASAPPSIPALALPDTQERLLLDALAQPQGLILMTGPTGSGKSTTLYAMLQHRASPEVNIVTVEDPIEYELPGAVQVQVNARAGLTFAATLRSILRQDPDVILVGEIRDPETAHIALQAATTGHLVLSTLHTNDTLSTLGRMLDLKVDPGSLAQSLSLVLAQRLARRVCRACAVAVPVPEAVASRLGLHPGETAHQGAGCDKCGGTGYAGRLAVLEVLPVGRELKMAIQKGAPEAELRRLATHAGYITLLEHGRMRIREGLTTPEEILRVLQVEQASTCGACHEPIDADYVICPYCATHLRRVCGTCRTTLKPEWKACPYCATPYAERLTAPPSLLLTGPRQPEELRVGREPRAVHETVRIPARQASRTSPATS